MAEKPDIYKQISEQNEEVLGYSRKRFLGTWLAIALLAIMTGRVKGKERVRIKAEIEAAPEAIVFATVAKEGLDIPAVDRIYLPSPSGNPKVTQQKIGRGTRIHEGKLDIIVFDFFDILVDIFRKQFRKRRFQCYDQLGLEVDLGG